MADAKCEQASVMGECHAASAVHRDASAAQAGADLEERVLRAAANYQPMTVRAERDVRGRRRVDVSHSLACPRVPNGRHSARPGCSSDPAFVWTNCDDVRRISSTKAYGRAATPFQVD